MVVMENGRALVNEAAEVVVKRMLQTAAGKMVFARQRRGHGQGYGAVRG